MATPELPSFDLVVASVDRSDALTRLLESLDRQTHRGFRVLVVDQNEDERLEPVLAAHSGLEIVRLRSPRGLSRARNAALPYVTSEIVAFPDDDCVYADDLLERVGRRFAASPELDGLSGREIDAAGTSLPSWRTDAAMLERDNLWNRAISFALFLRRRVVAGIGDFDVQLGLGSGNPWASGEEIDYLVRAVTAGALVEYDPSVVVEHDVKELSPGERAARGYRDGASVGYILAKHGYPTGVLARMGVRPLGGAVSGLVRLRPGRSRFHLAMLRGRIAGYRGGRKA